MSFPEVCERWLAGTTAAERERYVAVLDAHRGDAPEVARVALRVADLGASDHRLDALALIVSQSPLFGFNADGSGVMRTSDGREFRFSELHRFRGNSSF